METNKQMHRVECNLKHAFGDVKNSDARVASAMQTIRDNMPCAEGETAALAALQAVEAGCKPDGCILALATKDESPLRDVGGRPIVVQFGNVPKGTARQQTQQAVLALAAVYDDSEHIDEIRIIFDVLNQPFAINMGLIHTMSTFPLNVRINVCGASTFYIAAWEISKLFIPSQLVDRISFEPGFQGLSKVMETPLEVWDGEGVPIVPRVVSFAQETNHAALPEVPKAQTPLAVEVATFALVFTCMSIYYAEFAAVWATFAILGLLRCGIFVGRLVLHMPVFYS